MDLPEGLITALADAGRVAVLTGAGCSAESGVPTFREAQTGLWAQYDPGQLATPEAFKANPQLVWEWYAWRRALVAEAQPNAGHFALAALQDLVPGFSLITQNVDGLHQRAGSRDVLELHGSISRIKCSLDDRVVADWADGEGVPTCPRCGGLLRPDVVWFGESLPGDVLREAFGRAGESDVFLSVGTSSLVQPAATLPLEAAQHGALLVEINPAETPLTKFTDFSLRAPSGEALPGLVAALRRRRAA